MFLPLVTSKHYCYDAIVLIAASLFSASQVPVYPLQWTAEEAALCRRWHIEYEIV